jgi:hypothetical protein
VQLGDDDWIGIDGGQQIVSGETGCRPHRVRTEDRVGMAEVVLQERASSTVVPIADVA